MDKYKSAFWLLLFFWKIFCLHRKLYFCTIAPARPRKSACLWRRILRTFAFLPTQEKHHLSILIRSFISSMCTPFCVRVFFVFLIPFQSLSHYNHLFPRSFWTLSSLFREIFSYSFATCSIHHHHHQLSLSIIFECYHFFRFLFPLYAFCWPLPVLLLFFLSARPPSWVLIIFFDLLTFKLTFSRIISSNKLFKLSHILIYTRSMKIKDFDTTSAADHASQFFTKRLDCFM